MGTHSDSLSTPQYTDSTYSYTLLPRPPPTLTLTIPSPACHVPPGHCRPSVTPPFQSARVVATRPRGEQGVMAEPGAERGRGGEGKSEGCKEKGGGKGGRGIKGGGGEGMREWKCIRSIHPPLPFPSNPPSLPSQPVPSTPPLQNPLPSSPLHQSPSTNRHPSERLTWVGSSRSMIARQPLQQPTLHRPLALLPALPAAATATANAASAACRCLRPFRRLPQRMRLPPFFSASAYENPSSAFTRTIRRLRRAHDPAPKSALPSFQSQAEAGFRVLILNFARRWRLLPVRLPFAIPFAMCRRGSNAASGACDQLGLYWYAN
ncbi:unnamed protein product [Closterium sp. NIES-64]|nr:unnamed protein product [Closterium sp. NIES-64]